MVLWLLPEFGLVRMIMVAFTFCMIALATPAQWLDNVVPQFWLDLYRYGKAARHPIPTHFLIQSIQVPKRFFTHFYVFASIFMPVLLVWALLYGYPDHQSEASAAELWLLDGVCSASRTVASSRSEAILGLVLLSAQSFRRLYECVAVNVDSGSRMNLIHYIVGFSHYFCAGSGIICQMPGFSYPQLNDPDEKSSMGLGLRHFLATLVFLWAWRNQLVAHQIFAQLKKTHGGQHSIPKGSYFDWVSCPHYMCEVIIYSCLAVILGLDNTTWLTVWVWVLVNQVLTALLSHSWYQRTFPKYPKQRKAIFPFIL